MGFSGLDIEIAALKVQLSHYELWVDEIGIRDTRQEIRALEAEKRRLNRL